MMYEIFNVERFKNYAVKFYAEFRSLRLQWIIMTGFWAAVMCISRGEVDFFTLTLFLFVFSIVSASRMSAFFTTRANKIRFLLTPASHFEKLLVMVLHHFLVIPVMYAVSLFIAQYCATLITALLTLSVPHFTLPYAGIDIDTDLLGLFVLHYFNAVAFYLMGATIFTRHSFLKTTGVSMIVGFIFSILMMIAGTLHVLNTAAFEQLSDMSNMGGHFICVLSVIFTILFLVVAYMRLTEMEVNETKK